MVARSSKREDILEAALALLTEVGIEGFSASTLAVAAGVSKANLFHHFPTVDYIVLEAFERFAVGMSQLTPPAGLTLRQWLLGMGEASFGLEQTGPQATRAYFVFVAKALFDERLRLKVLGTTELASAAMSDIVGTYGGPATTHDEAEALGNLIFMTADGLAMHLFVFPERRNVIAAAWLRFVDAIAPGPKKRGRGR